MAAAPALCPKPASQPVRGTPGASGKSELSIETNSKLLLHVHSYVDGRICVGTGAISSPCCTALAHHCNKEASKTRSRRRLQIKKNSPDSAVSVDCDHMTSGCRWGGGWVNDQSRDGAVPTPPLIGRRRVDSSGTGTGD